MSSEITLALSKPLDCGNGDIRDSLDLREPTCGEVVKAMAKPGIEMIMALVGAQAGIAPNIVAKIGITDIGKAAGFFAPFLDFGPATTQD